MSLRARLFLLFGLLVAALLAAQIGLVRSLATELQDELGEVAFSVGRDVVSILAFAHEEVVGDGRRRVVMSEKSDLIALPPGEEPVRVVPGNAAPELAPGAPSERAGERPQVEVEHLEIGEDDGQRTVIFRVHRAGEPAAGAVPLPLPPDELALLLDHAGKAGKERRLELRGPDLLERIPVPRRGLETALAGFQERLLLGSAVLLVAGLVLAAGVAHGVTRPLRQLASAAREVEGGALGTQVGGAAGGEVGEAIAAFDRMSARLATLDRAAREGQERQHLAELGEVARGLAHSLRNPLHAVGLTVDELARRVVPEGEAGGEASELAAAARAQIARMDRSIRGLLALAAADGDAAGIADVAVARLVEGVALEALQDARGRVPVRVETGEDPLAIRGVEAELRAIVQALVVNAVEASPAGAEVVLRAARSAAGVRVTVEDRGPGLAPEVRARLFEPHVTTKSTGSGMGLFLARRLAVARYRGAVELAERPDGGTVAKVELGDRRPSVGAGGEAA